MATDITTLVHNTIDVSGEASSEDAIGALRQTVFANQASRELRIWHGDPPNMELISSTTSPDMTHLEHEIRQKEAQITELKQSLEAKDLEIARLSDQLNSQTDTPENRTAIKRARENRGTPHKNFRIPILRLLYKHEGSLPDFTKRVQDDPAILEMELLTADLELFQNKKPRWMTNIGNQAGDMQKEGLLKKRSHGVWALTDFGMEEARKLTG